MGARGRPCKICLSPELKARVESERKTGASYREIAALAGLDKYKIARHFKHAYPAQQEPVAGDELSASEARLAALSDQITQQFNAAVAVGDAKIALDASKTLARLEAERHRRIVAKRQEQADAAFEENNPGCSSGWADEVVSRVRESHARALRSGMVLCPVCGKYPVPPETVVEKLKSYERLNVANVAN